MGYLKYCFEESCVRKVLMNTPIYGLAVIDSDGIPARFVRSAVENGAYVYDYLNAGALERERSYYNDFKDLRLAKYDGWPGEYWVDPTSDKWKQHLLDEAKAKRDKGAIGLYFDNAGDILWMASEGFWEENVSLMRKAPSSGAVYRAMVDVITSIVLDLGMVVMPNGADVLVRKMFADGYGQKLIKTVNQEGVLYEDFKKQKKSETSYRTSFLDWCVKNGLYVRGIEYCIKSGDIAECKRYYKKHGWNGLYISKHKDLMGD